MTPGAGAAGLGLERVGQTRPVAIVTGGSKRVGAAVARDLASAGLDVVITYARSATEAHALTTELAAGGVCSAAVPGTLETPAGIEELARRLATLPRLDVLVHNASSYSPTEPSAVSADDALGHYMVNALAPLLLSVRLSPLLAKSPRPGGGSIVAMADMHVLGRPRKNFAPYAMSKAALVEMVRSLARDLAPSVRVNAVAPGAVVWPERGEESVAAVQDAYIRRVPLGRAGTPEEAAAMVRWLALEAGYVTGEVIRLDGGRWLA